MSEIGPSTAQEIAESLFQIMVVAASDSAESGIFSLSSARDVGVQSKRRLYHEAIVLMLLLGKVANDSRLEEILKSYERLIMPDPPTANGLRKLETLKAAMKNIEALIHPQQKGKELSWSAAWLREVGREEHNPIKLTKFAAYWIEVYAIAAGAIEKIRPAL